MNSLLYILIHMIQDSIIKIVIFGSEPNSTLVSTLNPPPTPRHYGSSHVRCIPYIPHPAANSSSSIMTSSPCHPSQNLLVSTSSDLRKFHPPTPPASNIPYLSHLLFLTSPVKSPFASDIFFLKVAFVLNFSYPY